jgi:starch-binding outer membrane protein, SusD/RagB family
MTTKGINMKKISIILSLIILLASCSKESLETDPNDRYPETDFWSTEIQAKAGLTACYQVLTANGIYGYATPLWEETATPNEYNYDNSAGFGALARGTQTAGNASTGTIIAGVMARLL